MPSSPRSRTRALTLVEVIASLALLGGLLGSAVLAKGRLAQQWSAAQQRGVAVERLDALLETWWAEGAVPVPGSGELTASGIQRTAPSASLDRSPRLRWTTHRIDRPALTAHGVACIAVRVWRDTADEPTLLIEIELFRYIPPLTPEAPEEGSPAARGAGGAAAHPITTVNNPSNASPPDATLAALPGGAS